MQVLRNPETGSLMRRGDVAGILAKAVRNNPSCCCGCYICSAACLQMTLEGWPDLVTSAGTINTDGTWLLQHTGVPGGCMFGIACADANGNVAYWFLIALNMTTTGRLMVQRFWYSGALGGTYYLLDCPDPDDPSCPQSGSIADDPGCDQIIHVRKAMEFGAGSPPPVTRYATLDVKILTDCEDDSEIDRTCTIVTCLDCCPGKTCIEAQLSLLFPDDPEPIELNFTMAAQPTGASVFGCFFTARCRDSAGNFYDLFIFGSCDESGNFVIAEVSISFLVGGVAVRTWHVVDLIPAFACDDVITADLQTVPESVPGTPEDGGSITFQLKDNCANNPDCDFASQDYVQAFRCSDDAPVDKWMLTTLAAGVGAFVLLADPSICYYFGATPSTTPGTIITLADIAALADCAECESVTCCRVGDCCFSSNMSVVLQIDVNSTGDWGLPECKPDETHNVQLPMVSCGHFASGSYSATYDGSTWSYSYPAYVPPGEPTCTTCPASDYVEDGPYHQCGANTGVAFSHSETTTFNCGGGNFRTKTKIVQIRPVGNICCRDGFSDECEQGQPFDDGTC